MQSQRSYTARPLSRCNLSAWLPLAILVSLIPGSLPAQKPPSPDFSGVSDILNGRRFLLQEDDLIVAAKIGNQPVNQEALYTSNSGIASKNSRQLHRDSAKGTAAVAYMYRNAVPVVVYGFQEGDSPFLGVRSSTPSYGAFEKFALAGPKGSTVRQLVIGDFNGDGLDDVIAVHGDGYLTVCTAKNADVYDLRLRCGPSERHGDYQFQRLTAGNLKGNGKTQLAWVYQRPGLSTSTLWIAEVHPATLQVRHIANYEGLKTGPLHTLDITAGKFAAPGNGPRQQIAFAYAGPSGTAKVDIIDFGEFTSPLRLNTWDTGYTPGSNGFSKIIIKAAPFNGFGPYDQIALLVSEDKYTQFLAVLTANPSTLTVTKAGWVFLRHVGVKSWKLMDMTIGNFDRKTSSGTHDASMQIALAGWNAGPQAPFVRDWSAYLFNVDPRQDFRVSLQQQFVDQSVGGAATEAMLVIAAADVQRRSLELGPVTKVVVNEQGGASVVTAAPPTHIDYVTPDGTKLPELLNLSAAPSFSTKFQAESSNTKQSTNKESVSYSLGFEEELNAEVGIGVPLLSEFSAGLKLAAKQTFENGVEQEYSNQQTTAFDVSARTVRADHVWYDSSRLNIYVYPVLGQTVCPENAGSCAEKDKRPVTVQFSGVDRPSQKSVAGNVIEWYQPVWEYGNVLSYPASYYQLQLLYPDLQQLSDDNTFATDGNEATLRQQWSASSSESKTVSSARRFEEGGGISFEGSAGVVSGSLSINVNNSRAFENLNTAVTNLGSSSGIEIHKPETFQHPTRYAYTFTPYIFGRAKRKGAVDDPKLTGAIKTDGPLQVAFLADPLASAGASWWKQAYSKAPDVALNHPARWAFYDASEPNLPNCLEEKCAVLAPPDPNNPWLSDFHAMRGFFISPADSREEGSQLKVARAGDKLTLKARVYNYSLVSMKDTTVHVRFYAQPMDPANNRPVGSSTLIGETVLEGGIPPFSDRFEAPLNSVLAATAFDTSDFANKYLSFWVVTWMEDRNGAMVTEPEGHGLNKKPGSLRSIADVDAQTWSNNVGFYKWLFRVEPRTGAELSAETDAVDTNLGEASMNQSRVAFPLPDQNALAEVQLGEVRIAPSNVKIGERIIVAADLTGGASPAQDGAVAFYDGDPKNGGALFEMEAVPYLQANGKAQVEVSFQPEVCGSHDIYAVAFEGTSFEKVSQSAPIVVSCQIGRR